MNREAIEKQFKETVTNFEELSSFDNFTQNLSTLMMLEDEQFQVLAPIVLEEINRKTNIPEEQFKLVEAMNLTGIKLEDLLAEIENLKEVLLKVDLSDTKKSFLEQYFLIIVNAISSAEGIAKRILQLPMEKIHKDAIVPTYANPGDSGMDLYALDDYTIKPGEVVLIPTGWKMAIPKGYEIQLRPKSGRALKTKLRLPNSPGTIDEGYRDELCVIIENVDPPIRDIEYHFDENQNIVIDSILHGRDYYIGKGEKFCQMVLQEVPKASIQIVPNILEYGGDRGGGFGSTGLK